MSDDIENVQDVEVQDQEHQEESLETVRVFASEDRNGYASPDDFPEDLTKVQEEETQEQNQNEVVNEAENQEETTEEEQEQETEQSNDREEDQTQEESTEEEQEADDSEFFSQLSQETELDIADVDTLVATLKEAKEVLDKGEGDAFADLPNELKLAIEVAKSGGDYKQAISALALDFDKMDGKEVLRQKFYQDNESLVQKDKEFADMKFEKEYESKYGLLGKEFDDEYAKEEFESENKRDIEYARKSLEREIEDSREALNEWKEQNITPTTQEDTVSETETQELIEAHEKNVQDQIEAFEGTYLSIDDNPENDFLVGVTDESRETLKEVLTDPRDFLSEVIGVDYTTGEINYEKLALAANVIINIDNIGNSIRQYSVEKKNKDTVEGMMENPKTRSSQDHTRQPNEEGLVTAAKQIRKHLYGRD